MSTDNIEQHQAPQPPVCQKKPTSLETHGDVRVDPYFWLNERENPEVIDYLKRENEYTEEVMRHTETFQESLFNEMVGRIKQDDSSVPYLLNGYWYYTRFEEGKEYPVYCRKKETLDNDEEILLNVNEMAKGHAYYQIGGVSVSPDNDWIAYGVDTVSRRIYDIYIKNLKTGEVAEKKISNSTGSATWAADNKTLFYAVKNQETLRSERIERFDRISGDVTIVYEEKDDTFVTYVYKSKSKKYLIIGSGSTLTNEYRILEAENPAGNFRIFQPRIRGMEYSIGHASDQWYILTNWEAQNFRLMVCGEETTERDSWKEKIAHREDVLLEAIQSFKNFLVVSERKNGLTQLRVIPESGADEHFVKVNEETYSLGFGVNPEYDTDWLRYAYSSFTTPNSVYDYHLESQERKLMKQQEVIGGYDASLYHSERHYVKAEDGVEIPVSLVYRKELKKDGNRPLLLYAYGSYGISIDVQFSISRLSLLDRGFIFAVAHIRGGEELGRKWYEDGKLLKKKNTFSDFITCGEYLIDENYTSQDHLYAMGGSAGGLLMGAVINMRPDLWNGVVAAVPFVDVVTTMLDETIPLTTGEFDEWGNPKEEEYYEYIKSYSPYDNVIEQEYPNMLVTTGLHDSQVQYWEPAKWVALLRDRKKDNNKLLLHTEMDFGHGGASGRFERFKEVALEYAFLFDLEGIEE